MVKRYRVTERSFINGALLEVGAVVSLMIDSPGSNLELLDAPADSTTSGQSNTAAAYTPKHNGGGRWVVVDASGEKVGDFIGASKEEAQSEADRLIAGGAPLVKPADSTTSGQSNT
ncbi:hypothetical protein [Pseudomonas monteilii]|uniref:hypothetical protein n=1 Tax=Pseudomonas monteilii TaxID=76759 RepID=UPI001E350C5A|nr:hypothetical protein [Pseudomonas monteilii]MCE0931635.1 hypothetical protein [Pseudomonas monteilii]MCE1009191.1 hypothetical protein [Pseudomonas monteilii]WJN90207.1 hypothetical protein LU680_09960 [Pseudomonas monteilii]WJO34819.1 hypothetical protein LU690_08635 [Pseudomonas monteilii]WJR41164.1 hypothetical protein LU662_009210 [Pseudomonas monteilii]